MILILADAVTFISPFFYLKKKWFIVKNGKSDVNTCSAKTVKGNIIRSSSGRYVDKINMTLKRAAPCVLIEFLH